tara:strand:- start:1283 stop:2269 length:987 start_codon:yes stop_codon:yes gene_type:complete
MNIINKISKELSDDIKLYELELKKSIKSKVGLINTVVNYALKRKGKRFRPLLCILCSRLEGTPNDKTFLSASTVEILHVATLLHDDVVDDAEIRRFWPTINTIWKNKLAILIGDYMFSKSLKNISNLDDLDSIKILSNTSDRLSEGEILQIENAINKNMSEEIYFKMISDKTASLISSACILGFKSTISNIDSKQKEIQNIKNFGEYLGIAYQLKDDLFDVIGKLDYMGKTSNLDLKKNMLTLPYIYMLSKVDNHEKKEIISKLKYHYRKKEIKSIKRMITDSGGIEYVNLKIEHFSNKAIEELKNFKDSKYKDLLLETVNFNLKRNY